VRRGLSAVAVVELAVAMVAAAFSSHGAAAPLDSTAGAVAEPAAPTTAAFYPVVQGSFAPAGSASPQAAPTRAASASSAPAPSNNGNNWAVLVGISHYQGNTHPTYGGDGDVADFQTLLQQAGWPSSHILVLTDGAATAANMRSAMNWLVSHSSPSSFTLFHYSGHVCEQGRGPCSGSHKYLWSVDNVLIQDSEFGQTMQRLQGWSWVDVAGCEAGAFDQGVSSSQRLFTGSSQASETSYEYPPWHESIWTGNLVDQGMLQRRAAQGSGPISIQQAAGWANQQVQQMTSGQSTGVQHPYIRGGTGQWYLASAAPAQQGGQPAPAPPPPAKPAGGTPPTTAPNKCGTLTLGLVKC
jgi:Caspase domain